MNEFIHNVRDLKELKTISMAESLLSYGQYRYLSDLVKKYVKKKSKVLDWGCGNGHISYNLVKSGYNTESYSIEEEPSTKMKQYLYSFGDQFNLTVVRVNDNVKLPYADKYFEAVLSVGVLEHVKDYGGDEIESLHEITRILKDDGYFICFHFPNKFSYIELINRHLKITPTGYIHNQLYTKKDIYKLCEASGLDIVKIKRYGALPRNLMNHLPAFISDSICAFTLINLFDFFLEKTILRSFCQNWFFIAKKSKNV